MRKTRAHLGAENIREKKNKAEKNKKKRKRERKKKSITHRAASRGQRRRLEPFREKRGGRHVYILFLRE
jgi:hypothetical protein